MAGITARTSTKLLVKCLRCEQKKERKKKNFSISSFVDGGVAVASDISVVVRKWFLSISLLLYVWAHHRFYYKEKFLCLYGKFAKEMNSVTLASITNENKRRKKTVSNFSYNIHKYVNKMSIGELSSSVRQQFCWAVAITVTVIVMEFNIRISN